MLEEAIPPLPSSQQKGLKFPVGRAGWSVRPKGQKMQRNMKLSAAGASRVEGSWKKFLPCVVLIAAQMVRQ